MNGWALTRVWDIDGKLVIAPTAEEAIALIRKFAGDKYYEPSKIVAVSGDSYIKEYNAIIKEEE